MTNKQEDKIIKFTQDYYRYCLCENDEFCLERHTDYEDEFPEDVIEEILSAKYPEDYYYNTIDEWDISCSDWSYQDDFWSELEDFCEEENKDIDEDSEEYLDFDEAKDCVIDNFFWRYPEEIINPEFTVKIELTSDYDGDFTKDNIDKDEEDDGLDSDYYSCPIFYVTLSLKDAVKIAGRKVKSITLKKGTYCEYSIWEDNDYYGGHDCDADGELNKDITIDCKDIYSINYESMDTDYEEVVLGEKIKESNHRRFSRKKTYRISEKISNPRDKDMNKKYSVIYYNGNHRKVSETFSDLDEAIRYASTKTIQQSISTWRNNRGYYYVIDNSTEEKIYDGRDKY